MNERLIFRNGDIRKYKNKQEYHAANHLIEYFPFDKTDDNQALNTVVWFKGNDYSRKASGGVEVGPNTLKPEQLRPGGFWTQVRGDDDIIETMTIDRQNYFNENDQRYCIYALQVGRQPSRMNIACVLVIVGESVGTALMRQAFVESLKITKNVLISPKTATA